MLCFSSLLSSESLPHQPPETSHQVQTRFFHVGCCDQGVLEQYCRSEDVAKAELARILHFSWAYQAEFCRAMVKRIEMGGNGSNGEMKASVVYQCR